MRWFGWLAGSPRPSRRPRRPVWARRLLGRRPGRRGLCPPRVSRRPTRRPEWGDLRRAPRHQGHHCQGPRRLAPRRPGPGRRASLRHPRREPGPAGQCRGPRHSCRRRCHRIDRRRVLTRANPSSGCPVGHCRRRRGLSTGTRTCCPPRQRRSRRRRKPNRLPRVRPRISPLRPHRCSGTARHDPPWFPLTVAAQATGEAEAGGTVWVNVCQNSQSTTARSLRSVIGRASSCSLQMRCSFSIVSSRPGPSGLLGVKVAGRCRMPWITPMVS